MATNNFLRPEDSMLILNTTGGTTNGRAILRLTDISVSLSNDVDETITLDGGWQKHYFETFQNITISCSGVLSDDSGESEFVGSASGNTKMVGTYNGLELLEVAKQRNTSKHIIFFLADSNYQSGRVVINSMEISGSVGAKYTYSIEMTVSGGLTKSTS